MSNYVNYKNNMYIEFPAEVVINTRVTVSKIDLYITRSGDLVLPVKVSAGTSKSFVYAHDYNKKVPVEQLDGILQLDPTTSELTNEQKDMVRRYVAKVKESTNVIKTDKATIDLTTEYAAYFDVDWVHGVQVRSCWAYKVNLIGSGEPSYVTVAAVETTNPGVPRYSVRAISTAAPGSILMSSTRLLSKREYNIGDAYEKGFSSQLSSAVISFVESWEAVVGNGAPEDVDSNNSESSDITDITYISFCDAIVNRAPGVTRCLYIHKAPVCRVATDPDTVYLKACDSHGISMGVVKASDRFDADSLTLHRIEYTELTDPADPTISDKLRTAIVAYAKECAADCNVVRAGDVTIHCDERYLLRLDGSKLAAIANRVSFKNSKKCSYVAARAITCEKYTACHHVRQLATATPGSYVSSSHKVYPEGSYEAVLDYTEDLSTGLEAWLSYTPASAELTTACPDVSDNGDVSYCVTDRYDYLAPRLDNLQEKNSVIISTLSAYSDRLDKVIDTLDEYDTALTVTSERVSEIQDCLNDFRNTLISGYHSLREDAAELQVRADAHAAVFLDAVTNYTASLAAKMDEEHAEHKACCDAIRAELHTLTQCAQDMIQYQERILHNQERRGIWAWIKSLFGK